jgi:hypothetical protein
MEARYAMSASQQHASADLPYAASWRYAADLADKGAIT